MIVRRTFVNRLARFLDVLPQIVGVVKLSLLKQFMLHRPDEVRFMSLLLELANHPSRNLHADTCSDEKRSHKHRPDDRFPFPKRGTTYDLLWAAP